MKVVFRADASLRIGSGHVVRCLTLADHLQSLGADTRFVCRALDGNLIDWIRQRGHQVCELPRVSSMELDQAIQDQPPHADWLEADWHADAAQTCEALRGERAQWMVVDHYALDSRWEKATESEFDQLLVIDDLADRSHIADFLVDQNYRRQQHGRYEDLVPKHCRLLLGPSFAILRPEFAQARAALTRDEVKSCRTSDASRVLIFLGGMDENNVTSQVLAAIKQAIQCRRIRHPLDLHVVIGATNPHRSDVTQQCERINRLENLSVRLLVQVADMATLMSGMDVAIASGGANTWERCCLGLPTATIAVAENQVAGTKELVALGACVFVGESQTLSEQQLVTSLGCFVTDREVHSSIRRASMSLVDGQGVERLASLMLAEAQSRAA